MRIGASLPTTTSIPITYGDQAVENAKSSELEEWKELLMELKEAKTDETTTTTTTPPTCTTYLPILIHGAMVIQKMVPVSDVGYGQWRTTNQFLNSATEGLAHRISKRLNDYHPDGTVVPWEITFWARMVEDRHEDIPWLCIAGLEPAVHAASGDNPVVSRSRRHSRLAERQQLPIAKLYPEKGTVVSWQQEAIREMREAQLLQLNTQQEPLKPTIIEVMVEPSRLEHVISSAVDTTQPHWLQQEWGSTNGRAGDVAGC